MYRIDTSLLYITEALFYRPPKELISSSYQVDDANAVEKNTRVRIQSTRNARVRCFCAAAVVQGDALQRSVALMSYEHSLVVGIPLTQMGDAFSDVPNNYGIAGALA